MKKFLYTVALMLLSISAFSQGDIVDSIQNQYDNQQYDMIISNHADKVNSYPARAIYYVAMAYYMKEDDNNCLKFMELSIEKNDKDPDPFYIIGMTYNYMGEFEKAIGSFEKAIELNSESSYFFTGLGDSYFNQKKLEKALKSYQTATSKNDVTDRPYFMIPQIYAAKSDSENALKAFYLAKENIAKDSQPYITVLYNIGLFEILEFNYDKAEIAYQELLTINPNDYESYSKMVQIYYGKLDYEKANPFRDGLYEAHAKGILKDHLEDMFCIHQFTWNNKSIRVFERYQEKPEKGKFIFNKHLFYVLNEKEEIESRIQTEYSAVSLELGGPKYVLGMNKEKAHYTFAQFSFNDDLNYEDLKAAVLKVLNKEVKPSSSSYRN